MSDTQTEKRQNRRKILQGVILKDKMDKSRVVQVNWAKKHIKYHKVVRFMVKYKAHDEKNETKKGDLVRIMETKPISKDKRWIIVETLKKGQEG